MQLDVPVSPITDWVLDPGVVHLNHGSYGGCPREVIAAATAWRTRLEAAPMVFYVLEWQAAIDRARTALAHFVRTSDERLVFVPNATTGVATALASARLAPGDEILATDHTYRACMNQLARVAASRGARVVVVPIALPFEPERLLADVRRAITPRTRLAVLDHITSPTALRLPLEILVPELRARGIAVLVDGAHAPGQLALDVDAIGATWYAGNCHKWLCAPKASGFLVAAPEVAAELAPLVTSHGASPEYGPANRLHAELDWWGTHDPTPHLAVPSAIATIDRLAGGWPAAIARNHSLALALRDRFVDALGGVTVAIAPDASLGSMVAIPIALPTGLTESALQDQLLRGGWEVPIVSWPTGPLLRLSAHLYNHVGEADPLARLLHGLGVRLGARP